MPFRPSISLVSTGAILPRFETLLPDSEVLVIVSRALKDIMYYIRYLEQESKRAQIALIHKIDYVIAMICTHYEFYDASKHWCSYMDFKAWDGIPDCFKKWWITETTRSESLIVGPSKCSSATPVDTLSLAAYSGLDLYVQHILTSQPDLYDPIALSRLLYKFLSVERRFQELSRYFPNIRLIVMLLNRGANPNTVYNHASVWQLFLYRMGLELSSPRKDSNTIWARAHAWGGATNAFLENGADVNDTIQFDFHEPFLGIINSEHCSELRDLGRYHLIVYQSVLSFLQQFSHVFPQFPQIQAVCLARGARLESRFRGFYDQWWERGLMLSDSESNELSKIHKTYCPNRCVPGTPEAREVVCVLADIWNSRRVPQLTLDPCSGRQSKIKRHRRSGTKTLTIYNWLERANYKNCTVSSKRTAA